ncbi:MAG: sodium:solute symporter family protein [Gemmatimonadota bacterium]|nr:sodium:solute symporter family protein [Gemmatimonadota bacterium]
MSGLDWGVVAAYLAFTLALGLWLARRARGGVGGFFVGGRALPWWLAGTSMAATTFSVDTPLYVSAVIARDGIAGNWEWWSFALSHLLLIYLFARLWRRAEIVTDVELTELRYGGRPAAVLRGARAFLFAVPINCVAIGLVMLAMRKVLEALGLLADLPGWMPGDERLWAVVALSIFVLVYAGVAGLWGVVATDFFQFALALLGAILVAGFALADIGGVAELKRELVAAGRADTLDMVPRPGSDSLPFGTFLAYLGIQWWAFRRSDGGGEFVQRLSASRSERDAERAAWLFVVLHYVVRAWPWILVGLASLVVFPGLEDPDLGYPLLMLRYLPAGLLGLVVASFIAAFMSTVSTQINWGASYLVNDLYARFVRPDATQAELVRWGRLSSVLIVAIAGAAAFFAEDIRGVFQFIIAIGTGPGAVLMLRWFWWRVNAWTELAAMLGGFTIALLLYLPAVGPLAFGTRLTITAFGTAAIWLPVMWLTRPEDDATLEAFYLRVRPGGPGWHRVRRRTAVEPAVGLGISVGRTVAATFVLFGSMFALGGAVLLEPGLTLAALLVAAAGGAGLWRLRRPEPAA